jgi:hypothetical protein
VGGLDFTFDDSYTDAREAIPLIARITAFGLPEPFVPSQCARDLRNLDSWHRTNLRGKLLIHPRAFRGAKKSCFQNPQLILDALLLLGTEYREVRIHGEGNGRQEALSLRLTALGLELSEAITQSRAGEEGDEYYIYYPIGQSQRRELLKYHLKKGNTRDERSCLRIYFFWDKGMKLVVVGWLPSHLDTRSS